MSAVVVQLTTAPLVAQQDSLALAGVHWREVGPYRGGRSVAATGNPSRPNEFWMGTTGGGVFKSINDGQSWAPVTDKYFGGTIGAIAVSASSPDVVYVGGGEYPIRGNVSHGDGVWKTTDGGKTWSFMGLGETRQIADIVVNPTNADLVYVGALGHVWAPNPERGVFRSKDGGKTWDKILFRNDSTGVVDLVMDPANPNVLYAGLWQAGRTPWLLSSGGKGSGMFKTTDGGDHWTEITRNPGLPEGIWGNIGITVSGGNSNRVWANIEADSGGVFRSDDAGATWQRINNDRNLRQRAWYYTKIHADSKDTNVIYANNVAFMKSTDGGKTFRPLRGGMHHGDSHDFWVDPKDNQRMIESDDGGAEVSVDGGKTWSDEDFATAQFYHVIATNHFPYHICGAQQDNSTLCGPSRGSLDVSDWLEAGGGESGWIASRGDDPDIVYAGSYGNLLTRKDLRTGITVNVNPWPDNPMGHPAMDLKYRFQWTFPIIVSTHNPNVVYAGSNVVHKSTNGGKSWTTISPDLTYHDPATLGNSGGPLTKDQTSIEYYGTVFIIEESPVTPSAIWTGSDDGKVYLTRNGGVKWTDVTPKDMAKYTRVSSIDASKFGECIAYVAANRFQLDDDKPYLWKTSDCGAHWTRIDAGINADRIHACRPRGSRQARPSRRRNRARRLVFDRRWSELAQPAAQPADRPGTRPRLQGRRHRARDARPQLLHHGRHHDARADDGRDRSRERPPVQAARSVSAGDRRRIRRWRRPWRRCAGATDARERSRPSDGTESAGRRHRAILARRGERHCRPRLPRRNGESDPRLLEQSGFRRATGATARGRIRTAPGASRPQQEGREHVRLEHALP